MKSPEIDIAVIGATGEVGKTIIDILDERDFPVGDLRLFASERSAGQEVKWQDRTVRVEDLSRAAFHGIDLALMSAGGSTSSIYAPKLVEAGVTVVDNSSRWRMDEEVPLVVSEVNPEALEVTPKGIIGNPNCTTMGVMPVIKPLHDAAGLNSLSVVSFQAASGAGRRGIDELAAQHDAGDSENAGAEVFHTRLAHNAFPMRGNLHERDTDEELKLRHESRKILGIENLGVDATCYSAGVFNGHSLTLHASFEDFISAKEAEQLLARASGVELCDVPDPISATGLDEILVGRVRQSDIFKGKGIVLSLAVDNIRKGAALNAVQIAELLVAKELVGKPPCPEYGAPQCGLSAVEKVAKDRSILVDYDPISKKQVLIASRDAAPSLKTLEVTDTENAHDTVEFGCRACGKCVKFEDRSGDYLVDGKLISEY